MFFATFPDAWPQVPQPQWVLIDQLPGEIFQGSGFIYEGSTTGYTAAPKFIEQTASVYPPRVPAETSLSTAPVTLHYDYSVDLTAHALDASPSPVTSSHPGFPRQHPRSGNNNDDVPVSTRKLVQLMQIHQHIKIRMDLIRKYLRQLVLIRSRTLSTRTSSYLLNNLSCTVVHSYHFASNRLSWIISPHHPLHLKRTHQLHRTRTALQRARIFPSAGTRPQSPRRTCGPALCRI